MYKWKIIDKSEIVAETIIVNKKITLDQSSLGQKFIQYKSGSSVEFNSNDSGSYWGANRVNFYLTGSQFQMNADGLPETSSYWGGKKYSYISKEFFNQEGISNPLYNHKFNDTGSVLSVSQFYFGDQIQRGSFKLTDNSHPSGTVEIIDDGYGNLYAPSASISSSATALSSSDNYIGNIAYSYGIINITETGSFSSDISYTTIGTGLDGGIGSGSYTVEFNSSTFIKSKEYSLKIGKKEFNNTVNPTARKFANDSSYGRAYIDKLSSPYLNDNILSGSISGSWGPIMTTVGFYRQNEDGTMDDEPILMARYPQAIMIRKDIDLILKVRIDI